MFRKFFCFLSALGFILFIFKPAYAAPVYGTSMPKEHRWKCGVEGDFIVDRNLDNDEGGTNGARYFLTCSYGIFSWFSFDGKIGISDVEWNRISNNDINYGTNFAGGYGFRINGLENKEAGIKSVLGFQHISVHPEEKNQAGIKNEAIIDEWQGSIVISKKVENFIPYLGGRYGSLDFIKWENEHNRKRIKSEKLFGIIMGMDYWLDEKTKLNLESAFLDGEEIAIGISRDF